MNCIDSSTSPRACGLLLAAMLCCGSATAETLAAQGGGRAVNEPAARFTLRIDGAIEPPGRAEFVQLDIAALKALPQQTVTTHTPWHDGAVSFAGPRLWDLLEPLKPAGKTVRIMALNDYSVDIPLSDLQRYGPVLAWQLNGKAIGVRNKGPVLLIYPFDSDPVLQTQLYYGRSIWQIKTITVK